MYSLGFTDLDFCRIYEICCINICIKTMNIVIVHYGVR